MNKEEAYSLLELPSTSTLDEIKKQYKALAKKWHPDINKDNPSSDKFKKINEAYDFIKSNKQDPIKYNQVQNPEHINMSTDISFKESVLGCKRDIKYTRNAKCEPCQGNGFTIINNGCSLCQRYSVK